MCLSIIRSITLLSATLACGCATNATILQAPSDYDKVFTLPAICQKVIGVLPEAMLTIGLRLVDDMSRGADCPTTILARKPISPFSWGEIVRISLAASATDQTELRVHTERVVKTNLTARGNWAPQVHAALLDALAVSSS